MAEDLPARSDPRHRRGTIILLLAIIGIGVILIEERVPAVGAAEAGTPLRDDGRQTILDPGRR